MNDIEIISTNYDNIKKVSIALNNYYNYASTHFFTGFGQEELEEFKAIKRFLDKAQIEIANSSNEIAVYLIQDSRLEGYIKLLMENQNYSGLRELQGLTKLKNLKIKIDTLASIDNSEIARLMLTHSTHLTGMIAAMKNYNDNILVFKNIQTEQYEILGTFSKALKFFFNYESSSRLLKQYILNLELQPLNFLDYVNGRRF